MSSSTPILHKLTVTVVATHDEFDLTLLKRASEAREMLLELYPNDLRERDAELWNQIELLLRRRLGEPSPSGCAWGRQSSVWGDGIQPIDFAWPDFPVENLEALAMSVGGRFHGFSVAAYFYAGALGSGSDRIGALWMNNTALMTTAGMARRLSISA